MKPKSERRTNSSSLVLLIGATPYVVQSLPCQPEGDGRVFRLLKGDGATYDLVETRHGPACDCPDFIFRRDGIDPNGCKHVQALVRHGLMPRVDQRPGKV
jgi:hypothetical protein